MFSCEVYLKVFRKDGDALLTRWVDLPFAPSKGDRITFDEEEADTIEIDFVEFYVFDGHFVLSATDECDRKCPCGPSDNCCSIDSEVEFRTGEGWEMDSVRKGYSRMRKPEPWMFEPEKWILTKPQD